jgi:aspartyl-tRNA(Asn)/glutamyl-tRNA(Gln) amidotransferase subunit B
MTPELETIIGLEVHAQMSTTSKMFCGCDNDAFGKPPNTTVCPICMGHPGTLPAPNEQAFEKAVRTALALSSTVNRDSHFDRKHYFYPDLPAGFQVSQYDFPLAVGGNVSFDGKQCRIHRLHIENDAGKLTHRGHVTLCDYNRAGTPLMEIVTEPDLRSADDAVAFVEELRRILIAVDASEADMFKGMMRFDASISLRERGSETLNPRSEIKNLNSFKSLEKALRYEEKRLRALWEEEHGPLKNNITVGWMDDEEKTRMLRDKETADDYRYFPEPDIPPMRVDDRTLNDVRGAIGTLPSAVRERYVSLRLSPAEVTLLVDTPELRAIFDAVQARTKDAKRTGSLVLTQLLGFLNTQKKSIAEGPSADAMLELVDAVDRGTISANAAKEVLEEMVTSGKSAGAIIKERGMQQISDEAALEEIVKRAVAANPSAIESYKKGKPAALGAIVGWVMKETKGQADPATVNKLLQKHLQ